MKANQELFEKASVPKAVAQNAIPAIISMLVVLIYNMADTFFVGQTGDTLQVAAVSITTPVFLIFMAIGTLFGIGGTSVISRSLGEGREEYARKTSSFCFWSSAIVGILFIIAFLMGMEGILKLIGTSGDTIHLAREYLQCITFGAPFIIISTAFSNIVRAEGKSKEAMWGMMIGTVVNIVLDPIMILGLGMGVKGAALATVIGNIVSTIYYIFYFKCKDSILSISPKEFKADENICISVLGIGIPASLNNLLMSASSIIMNNLLVGYGDAPVAAMGIATKVNLIAIMLLLGLGMGIQPLIGYCFGSKNYQRFKSIMKFSLSVAIIMGCILTLICFFGADILVSSFIDKQDVYDLGVQFVKAIMISSPLIGVLFVLTNALQAMGAVLSSLILSISRQGFVYIPLLYILNALFRLDGVVYAQPVADFIAIGLSIFLCIIGMKKFSASVEDMLDEENLVAEINEY